MNLFQVFANFIRSNPNFYKKKISSHEIFKIRCYHFTSGQDGICKKFEYSILTAIDV